MRFLRAFGALVVLVATTVGVPAALVALGGDPLPDGGVDGVLGRLLRPDDGGLLVGLITVVAWVAWLVFTLSVLVELVNLAAHLRRRPGRIQLPGLAGPQHLAGFLLAAVVAAVLAPAVAGSGPVLPAPPGPMANASTATSTQSDPLDHTSSTVTPGQQVLVAAPTGEHHAPKVPQGHLHLVERGDDLWSLAERFYGQGREWRRIAAANPDELTGGPDRLRVGARLVIPGVAAQPSGGDRVVVRDGDTLASLAERAYGEADDWPRIFAANRHLIADPDQIDVGLVLTVPERPSTSAPTSPTRRSRSDSDDRESTGGDRAPTSQPVPTAPGPGPASGPAGAPTEVAPTEVAPTEVAPTEVAPTEVAPTEVAPTEVAPTAAAATTTAPTFRAEPAVDGTTIATTAPLVGVGGLLAAGLIGGLLLRRRLQLAARPVGRRVLHPSDRAQTLEAALGHRQEPMTVASLDLVLRAVALHCHRTGRDLPELMAARVSPAEIELVLRVPDSQPPVGFIAQGRRWLVAAGDAGYLAALDGIDGAPRAYPTLVTAGTDDQDRQVLVELEHAGHFGYVGLDDQEADGFVLAMGAELALAPWADELFVTLVGTDAALPDAAARHNLTRTDDVDALLDRLERRADVQRRHLGDGSARQKRVDPELSDPWAPEVVLVARPLDPAQATRLRSLVTREPRVTTAAVLPVALDDLDAGLVRLPSVGPQAAESAPGGSPRPTSVELRPLGWDLELQQLTPAICDQVVELLAVTGSDATTPAPWWHHEQPPPAERTSRTDQHTDQHAPSPVPADEEEDGTALPANVTVLTPAPRRAWADEEDAAVARLSADPTGPVHHPTVLLLGPVDLVGVTGVEPTRAARQCVEYCAWLLEHPHSSAPAMAAALAVAEGTRRSNVSRLRTWLGEDPGGQPYLPDAYSGRIVLDPTVSSDWQRLQILTAPGINRTSTDGLVAALALVRGAPLADAAPGQWHWAEELRTDMASAVRDLGIELTNRAIDIGDLDLARWAASRALAAAPEDEQLLCARIRTEHRAGHTADVERLALRVSAQARTLGIDLDPDTVILLQQVMEGRMRARTGGASR